MDLYNIKIDAINFLRKNRKFLIFLNIFTVLGMIVGCAVAFGADCQTVFETSGNAYFIYLSDASSSGVAVNIFVSAVIYIVLFVLSKAIKITRKIGFLLICYRVYEVFYRMTIIMLYFGVKSVFIALVICLVELSFCVLLEIIYMLNNSERRDICKDWITEEYLISVGVIALVALIFNILLCLLFSALNFLT